MLVVGRGVQWLNWSHYLHTNFVHSLNEDLCGDGVLAHCFFVQNLIGALSFCDTNFADP